MSSSNQFSRRKWEERLIGLTLLLVSIFAIFPIFTTITISFKEQADITRKPPIFFPCDTPEKSFEWSACRWAVEGWERVFAPKPDENALLGFKLTGNLVKTYIPNTILYAFSSAIGVTLLASLSGFAFSRYRFKGHNALMTGIYAVTGIPLITNMLALYQMSITFRKGLPFWDDRLFLIFVYFGFFLPLSVWITKGFFDAIPRELEESALIEGCSPLGAMFRITMPLAIPGLISVFLMTFVNVWNEFIVAYLLVTKNEYKPAMFGLYDFLSQNIVNMQVLAAACLMIAAPIIILFIFTRKTFFRAMVEGAVKG
ncbi:MAG: carbohydrate ABC transporter permease [Anaerolineaceae bacterium]|jgi:multiple sugar transport system permease protein|nr:carbohydrate ABC transporter permease [Anaerolineaceae bacterium]